MNMQKFGRPHGATYWRQHQLIEKWQTKLETKSETNPKAEHKHPTAPSKQRKQTQRLKENVRPLVMPVVRGEDLDKQHAKFFANPTGNAALTIKGVPNTYGKYIDSTHLMAELETLARAASDGDLSRGESMLVAQMHSLDAIYNCLASLGSSVLMKNIDQGERLYRLAFKAQSQCRTTIEALAEIKNPRQVAFVKQANIAGGNQQVNNGTPSRTGESAIPQNKLLGAEHGERLDIGTAGAAGGADSQLETVGAVNGAKDSTG